jgi:hypothetical protein
LQAENVGRLHVQKSQAENGMQLHVQKSQAQKKSRKSQVLSVE